MKHFTFLLVVTVCALYPAVSQAQISVSGGVETVSQYVWRGYALVNGPTLQPTFDLAWEDKGLSVNLWGSAAMTERGQYGSFDEFDITLNYNVPTGAWGSLDAGLIFYTFPNQQRFSFDEHTSPEFYVNVAPSLPLNPALFVAYDVNLGGDFYAALGIGQDFSLGAQSFSLGLTAGYNNGQFEAVSGFSHVDVSLSTALVFGPVSLVPRAVYVHSFENTDNLGDRLFFGIGLGL